jgi:hypothetical protein
VSGAGLEEGLQSPHPQVRFPDAALLRMVGERTDPDAIHVCVIPS